ALLEQRHRPQPSFDNPDFNVEWATTYAVERAVEAAAGGPGGPPFPPDATTLGLGPSSPINIPPGQISILQPKKPSAVVLQVQVKAPGQMLWVAAWQVTADTPIVEDKKSLLAALFAILKAIQSEPAPGTTPEKDATAIAVRLGPEVKAVVAKDKDTAIK